MYMKRSREGNLQPAGADRMPEGRVRSTSNSYAARRPTEEKLIWMNIVCTFAKLELWVRPAIKITTLFPTPVIKKVTHH